jgi:hypothetical protein
MRVVYISPNASRKVFSRFRYSSFRVQYAFSSQSVAAVISAAYSAVMYFLPMCRNCSRHAVICSYKRKSGIQSVHHLHYTLN